MNSSEVKEALLADPTHATPALLRALQQDPTLREYFNQALELDAAIRQAMQTPVPDDLEERLLNISCTATPTGRRSGRRPLLWGAALAAGLALAVFSYQYFGFRNLSAEIIAHVQHEPAALMFDNGVEMEDVRTLLADHGLKLMHDLDRITYLARCRVQGHAGIHMVLQTDNGRVTVLLVPGLSTPEMTEVRGHGLEGYVIGLYDRYSMAIVGQAGQPLMQVERLLRDAITVARPA